MFSSLGSAQKSHPKNNNTPRQDVGRVEELGLWEFSESQPNKDRSERAVAAAVHQAFYCQSLWFKV